MYLSISTTHKPATDLGFLLHKNPDKVHTKIGSQGMNYCFFPIATEDHCTACLVLDIPITHEYRKKMANPRLNYNQYVNDRPYVTSSLMSGAIADMFGTALNGRSKSRQELAETEIPLEIEISVVNCEDGETFIRSMLEPLGYDVAVQCFPLDEAHPEWGMSPYFNLKLTTKKRLSEMLRQLYVLLPVFDNFKHYWIDFAETDKLLRMGEGWLANHPMAKVITQRSLKHLKSLADETLEQLLVIEPDLQIESRRRGIEEQAERKIGLNEQRLITVAQELAKCGAKSVLDLGCGEGKLLEKLIPNIKFEKIVGIDVGIKDLERATQKLEKFKAVERFNAKFKIYHGSLNYYDSRTVGFDASVLLEVIEHIDPIRLDAVTKNIFEKIGSRTIILTTPNREFNIRFVDRGFRHPDHRFEWNRDEFQKFCESMKEKYNYSYEIKFIGEVDPELGGPTQMGVFTKCK